MIVFASVKLLLHHTCFLFPWVSCFSTFWTVETCLCVSAGTLTICSRVCCCTRSFNGWICCSRAAARSACALREFVQSGFSSSVCSLLLGVVRISLCPERMADLSDNSLVSHSSSFWMKAGVSCDWCSSSTVRCWTCSCGRLWQHYNGHVYFSMRILALASLHNWDINDHVNALGRRDVHGLLHCSFRNRLLRNHLDHFNNLHQHDLCHRDVHDLWRRAAPVGPPRSATLLHPKRLLCITTGMSVSCASGTSTIFRIFWMSGTVSASWVRFHELSLRCLSTVFGILCMVGTCLCVGKGTSMVLSMNCSCWASKHCLSHRRLSSHNDWYVTTAVQELHLLSLRWFSLWCLSRSPACSTRWQACFHVRRRWDCLLLGRCCCEELYLVHIVARVSLRRLASSTLPAVGTALLPAVGPLCLAVVALFTRCGSTLFNSLDLPPRRSGPLVSASSNLTVMFTESAGFTQVLVVVVQLLLDDLVRLSVWL